MRIYYREGVGGYKGFVIEFGKNNRFGFFVGLWFLVIDIIDFDYPNRGYHKEWYLN